MTGEIIASWQGDRIARLLLKAPEILFEELRPALTEASMLLEREIKERTPTSGAGTLRDSIGALPVTISKTEISAGAATSLAYALPVELGAKKHWMPIEPLIDWVERKLGKAGDEAKAIARMIRFKIAAKGTEGRFMFRDGGEAVRPQFVALVEAALTRTEKRLEGSPA